MDFELTAIVVKCSAIGEETAKAVKKKEMNKNFLKKIAIGGVKICCTSIFFYFNCEAPLTAIISNTININTANINIGPDSPSKG